MDVDERTPEQDVDPLSGDPRLPEIFGEAWPRIERFQQLLIEQGSLRGLIGPREAGRLWERHLLNSAGLVPHLNGVRSLVDVGSGAGLPGVVVAAMSPEMTVTLLEPMARRVDWLHLVVADLELRHVRVVRGRAEEMAGTLVAEAATARAVAPLEKLYRWTAPLVAHGGLLLALKGSRVHEEVVTASQAAREAGWSEVSVVEGRLLEGVEPTTVVRAVRRDGARRVR